MYQLFWIFFIYAFLGWCTEVSFAAVVTKGFVNRGFLNGPVCPIYGFGVVLVLACLTPLKDHLPVLFVGSVVLTSLLELVTGFVLEKIFHQSWWDYSDERFNIGGYICLRFSLVWGVACVFVVKVLHPMILLLIRLVPRPLGWVLLAVFGAALAVDLAATVRTIARINRKLGQIDELASKMKGLSNEFGENLADRVMGAAEKGADLKEDLQEKSGDIKENLAGLKAGLLEKSADFKEDLLENLDEARDALSEGKFRGRMELAEWTSERREELEKLRAKLDEALDNRVFGQRRLLQAFPKLRSLDHDQAMEQLRSWLGKR